MKKTSLVTHNSVFHCDDAMATAILKNIFPDAKVFRTNKPEQYKNDDNNFYIIYDIGFGEFDHHQKGGNGARDNGVPYASSGLIWKSHYGEMCIREVLKNTMPDVYPAFTEKDISGIGKSIDNSLIQGIDSVDNGYIPPVASTVAEKVSIKQMTLNNIVSSFNTLPYDGGVNNYKIQNIAFLKAVDICSDILVSNIRRIASIIMSNKELEKLANERDDEHILVLNKYIPWIQYVTETESCKDIWYVLFPSARNAEEWNMQAVPLSKDTYDQRHSVPKSWWGGNKDTLPEITGVKTASFCHQSNGFLTVAGNFDDIMKLANIACNNDIIVDDEGKTETVNKE